MGCGGSKNPSTFRGSGYHKNVCCSRRTVKQGECCAVWDGDGDYTLTEGPARLCITNSTVTFLDRFVADQGEYLKIRYRDGRKEHLRGPCAQFEDPMEHTSIEVLPAISLDAFETVVVYREIGRSNDGAKVPTQPLLIDQVIVDGPKSQRATPVTIAASESVEKRLVRGPTVFIPAANEWLHEFCWHGNDPVDKGRLIKGGLNFTKLKTVPAQLYYNVSDVRTQDDAMLRIKLMIFYHIESIQRMLDSTSDPIGDFSNAVCADVIRFVSEHSFESFLQQTNALNELDNYQTLIQRAETVGFVIDKVVFRGYKASDHLQQVYDHAIQTRAEMMLKAEQAEQAEAAEDLRLIKKVQRAEKERELEVSQRNHQIALDQMRHQHDMQVAKEAKQVEIEATRNEYNERLTYIDRLAALKAVDLTQVIMSENQKDARVIRVEDGQKSQTHLHLSS